MRNDKDNLIVTLTFDFALDIIDLAQKLKQQKKFEIAHQVFKSGTSIGANVREAQNAESKKDFIHKLKIAAKEADETEYWLQLCKKSSYIEYTGFLDDQLISIIRVLSKIISSSKKSSNLQISKSSNYYER